MHLHLLPCLEWLNHFLITKKKLGMQTYVGRIRTAPTSATGQEQEGGAFTLIVKSPLTLSPHLELMVHCWAQGLTKLHERLFVDDLVEVIGFTKAQEPGAPVLHDNEIAVDVVFIIKHQSAHPVFFYHRSFSID